MYGLYFQLVLISSVCCYYHVVKVMHIISIDSVLLHPAMYLVPVELSCIIPLFLSHGCVVHDFCSFYSGWLVVPMVVVRTLLRQTCRCLPQWRQEPGFLL